MAGIEIASEKCEQSLWATKASPPLTEFFVIPSSKLNKNSKIKGTIYPAKENMQNHIVFLISYSLELQTFQHLKNEHDTIPHRSTVIVTYKLLAKRMSDRIASFYIAKNGLTFLFSQNPELHLEFSLRKLEGHSERGLTEKD